MPDLPPPKGFIPDSPVSTAVPEGFIPDTVPAGFVADDSKEGLHDDIRSQKSYSGAVQTAVAKGATYNPELHSVAVNALAQAQKEHDAKSGVEKIKSIWDATKGMATEGGPGVMDQIVTKAIPATWSFLSDVMAPAVAGFTAHSLEEQDMGPNITPEQKQRIVKKTMTDSYARAQRALTEFGAAAKASAITTGGLGSTILNNLHDLLANPNIGNLKNDVISELKDPVGTIWRKLNAPGEVQPDSVYKQRAFEDLVYAQAAHEAIHETAGARPEQVENLMLTADPMNVLMAGTGFLKGAKTAAETATIANVAARAATTAKIAEETPGLVRTAAGQTLQKTGRGLVAMSENPVTTGLIAGTAVAAAGGEPATIMLASIIGAGNKSVSLTESLLGGTGRAIGRTGERLAKTPMGPMSRAIAGTAEFLATSAAEGAKEGVLMALPFAYGQRDEAGALEALKGGAEFGALGHVAGSTYGKAKAAFDIDNFFRDRSKTPDSQYVRPEFSHYGDDPANAMNLESKSWFDRMSNKDAQNLEALKEIVGSKGADGRKAEIYLMSREMADQAAKDLNTGRDQAGAGFVVPVGDDRRVVVINMDANKGIALGHEVGHAISFALPPEVKTKLMDMVLPGKKSILDSDVFDAIKRDYEDRINLRRNADGSFSSVPEAERVSLSDVDAAEEYIAENFSAMLHGLPPGKLGTPLPLVSKLRLSLGAMLEKSGARKLTATDWTGKTTGGEAGGVTTAMGYKPSFAVAQVFDNFLQSGKLESARFPGEEAAPQIHVPGTEPVLEKPTAAPAVSETISNVSEVEPKAPVEGFKKGDPIGEIKDKNGMLIAEEAKISKVLENGMYEIEFTDPDTGKRMRGTADEQSLQSPLAIGKTPTGRDVFYPSPVTTETPAGIARPETLPTAAEIVAPKQVENVTRPEAPSVTKPSASLRPAAAEKFAAKADDSVHRQNRDKLEKIMAAPRAEIPAVETDYYAASSPVQSPDAAVRETQRRAADAIDAQGKTNPFRTTFQKLFVPYRWSAYKLSPESNARLYGASAERKAGGVYGMSVDKVGQNVDLLRGLALENPKLAQVLSRKGFSDAYLTSNELISDFQKYLNNQAHGFGGGGEQLRRPPETRAGTVTEQAKGFVPAVLPIEKRQLFNLLLNYEQQGSRSLGMEYSERFAKLNGIDPLTVGTDSKGRPLTENNALRAEAMKAGFDPRVLNSAVENLPTENFTTPLKERRDITFPASDVAITQAGFMPEIPEGATRRVQGNEETRKIATDYIEKSGLGTAPHETYAPTNETTLKRIADFYENAKHEPDNPDVAAAYRALADETRAQYDEMVKADIKIEPYEGKGEPYANSAAMLADVRDNKHLYFFLTDKAFGEGGVSENNALLQKSGISINGHDLLYNDLFRAVHDYFGHTAEGFEFGPRGEYNAYLAHSRMFSDAAKPALAAETLAQNAWVNFGPHLRRTDGSLPKFGDADFVPIAKRRFADQKNTVVPKELLEAADTAPKATFMPETPEFKEWFGKSKVVDENGNPKAVYHGSNMGGISSTTASHAYFTDSPTVADSYAFEKPKETPSQSVTQKVFLKMENPLVVDAQGADWHNIPFETSKRRGQTRFGTGELARIAESEGRDGVIVKNVVDDVAENALEPSTVYITLGKQAQIKSATGNKGTFDPKNRDIRFMPEMPLQLQSRRKLPHAIEDKELILVHRSGSAGLETIDPSKFGKSGITPRSERSGEDRSYFYVKGLENKGDLAMNRPYAYEIPVSGKRIYDADTDALNWEGTINRQKADLMLKDAGYAGVLRTRGEGKKTFKQVELFEEVKTPAQEKTLDDLKDEILNSPRGEKAAERIAKQVGSSSNGEYFDALDAWVEKELEKKSKASHMPEEPLAQAIDKIDSPVESLEAAGGKIDWKASYMPEIDPSAFPTMSQSILDRIKQDTDTVAAIHMDRMRVGSYKGIDLQGGMFYPTIRENLDKGVVWAFNDDKTARKVANQAAKNNGYVKLVLMSEGNVIGNRTFTSIWFHDLKENIASGALKEKTALRELNRVRKNFADFTGHKTAWTNLEDAQKDITEMAQIRRGQSYFQRSKTNTKGEGEKTAYGSLLTKSMTENGFPDAVQIVSDIEEPAFKGIPQGSAVAVLRFDPVPAGSKIKTASEMGVPEHASYKYVLTGKPVAKLENYAVVDLAYPEMKNQIMTQQVTQFPAQESLIPKVPHGRITYGSELSAETARQAAPAREAPLAQEAVIKKSKSAAAPLADVTL